MADDAREQIDVAASPARCFDLATTFERYPDWTSDVKQATVVARDAAGRGTRVEYLVTGLGRRVRYVLDYDFSDAPRSFSWSLVEGDMLRTLDGRYAFAPTDDGTHVEYTLRIDLTVPMPGLLKRRASGMIMGNALRDLKRAVEAEAHDEAREHDMDGDDAAPQDPTPFEPTPVEPAQFEPAQFEPAQFEPATFESAGIPPTPLPHPDAVPFEDAGTEERPLPPPSILESVLTELLGAVPEVKDHVLEAADALLDAAKALVDAADRIVRQQRGEE